MLALLARDETARVSPIAHRLSASRTAISATFAHLLDMQLVRRNAGHGHPLRPEYALTDEGQVIAAWARALHEDLNDADELKLLRMNWTLPVLRLTDEAQRFSGLRSDLTPITDRALSLSLKGMVGHGWLSRLVRTETTPVEVSYLATGRGRLMMPQLRESMTLLS